MSGADPDNPADVDSWAEVLIQRDRGYPRSGSADYFRLSLTDEERDGWRKVAREELIDMRARWGE